MKARPYSPETVAQIDLALINLKRAAGLLRSARCPLTSKKVRSAIKSAEGARNNAHARQYRDERQSGKFTLNDVASFIDAFRK